MTKRKTPNEKPGLNKRGSIRIDETELAVLLTVARRFESEAALTGGWLVSSGFSRREFAALLSAIDKLAAHLEGRQIIRFD